MLGDSAPRRARAHLIEELLQPCRNGRTRNYPMNSECAVRIRPVVVIEPPLDRLHSSYLDNRLGAPDPEISIRAPNLRCASADPAGPIVVPRGAMQFAYCWASVVSRKSRTLPPIYLQANPLRGYTPIVAYLWSTPVASVRCSIRR